MTMPPGAGPFSYEGDTVAAKLSIDVPADALANLKQVTQGAHDLRVNMEAAARAQSDFVEYLRDLPALMAQVSEANQRLTQSMERTTGIESGRNDATQTNWGQPEVRLTHEGALQDLAERNPRQFANLMAQEVIDRAGRHAGEERVIWSGDEEDRVALPTPRQPQRPRQSTRPADTDTRSRGPGNRGPGRNEEEPEWVDRFKEYQDRSSSFLQTIMNETRAGGTEGVGDIAGAGLRGVRGIAGRVQENLAQRATTLQEQASQLEAAGDVAGAAEAAGRAARLTGMGGMAGMALKGAGAAGLVVGGLAATQNVGEWYQGLAAQGMHRGGGFQEGLEYEMGVRAQPLTESVLTPGGWVKMGDLTVGDRVISGEGTPTTVLGTYDHGVREVYEVVFADGGTTRCTLDHLWGVYTENNDLRVMRFEDMLFGKRRNEYGLLRGKGGRPRYRVPLPGPIEFAEKEFPVDPYTLGVLLGDGSHGSHYVGLTCFEVDLYDMVLPDGVTVVELSSERGGRYYFKGVGAGIPNPMVTAMREVGLMGVSCKGKFIPDPYLFGSVEQRFALLQGLVDTDGNITAGGRVFFKNSSKSLVDGVEKLVLSLGGKAYVNTKPAFISSIRGKEAKTAQSYSLEMRLPFHLGAPSRLARKACRYTKDHFGTRQSSTRQIVSAVRVSDEECRCIYVEHSGHLYVTENYIVTHNTMAMNPFISLEQSRKIMQSAMNQGYTGKEFDTVTEFMTENLTKMNVDVAQSVKVLQNQVQIGGQSLEAAQAGLAAAQQLSANPESRMTAGQAVDQFTQTAEQVVQAGGGGEGATELSLVSTAYGEENDILKGIGGRMVEGMTTYAPFQSEVARAAGYTGPLSGAVPAAIENLGPEETFAIGPKILDGMVARYLPDWKSTNQGAHANAQQMLIAAAKREMGITLTIPMADELFKQAAAGKMPSDFMTEAQGNVREAETGGDVRQLSRGGEISAFGGGVAEAGKTIGNLATGVWNMLLGNDERADESFSAASRSNARSMALTTTAGGFGQESWTNTQIDKLIREYGTDIKLKDEHGKEVEFDVHNKALMQSLVTGKTQLQVPGGDWTTLENFRTSLPETEGGGGTIGGGTFSLTPDAAKLLKLIPDDQRSSNDHAADHGSGPATHNNPLPGYSYGY